MFLRLQCFWWIGALMRGQRLRRAAVGCGELVMIGKALAVAFHERAQLVQRVAIADCRIVQL
ncbi:hypothetical protein D3C81_2239770 [compost metagenome]